MFVFRFFKSLPVQLLLCLGFALIFANDLPLYWVRMAYTLSHLFIGFLLFILPWLIALYLFCAVVALPGKALSLIGVTFVTATLSNLLALWTSYGISQSVLPHLSLSPLTSTTTMVGYGHVSPFFNLPLPCLMTTSQGILLGVLGALLAKHFLKSDVMNVFSKKLSDNLTKYLKRFFIPLLPLYVFGFCLKMGYEDTLIWLFEHMFKIYGLGLISVILYVVLIYFIASGGKPLRLFKTFFSAGLTGFVTMSSAVAMPLSIEAVETYTKNASYAQFIIPSTSNIHMISDDMMIVLFSQAFLLMNHMSLSDPSVFFWFSLSFCLAKFSCVGLPGASVLVILPVVEKYMGFTPEMIGLLTAIYVLQDATGACLNILGNGGFCTGMYRLFQKMKLI
jgi:Na+/H+-dicarboxylate symporter